MKENNKINTAIMDFALRGSYDGAMPVEIYWNAADHFLAAYMVNLDHNIYDYRLFYFWEESDYDKKIVLSPVYGEVDDNGICIYDCSENRIENSSTVRHCADGSWFEEFQKICI